MEPSQEKLGDYMILTTLSSFLYICKLFIERAER